MFSSAGNDARAEDKIADRTAPRATRPRQPAGDHPAPGGFFTIMRRLTGKHLPGALQRRFNRHQRRSGTSGYHQLGRVVINNAAMTTHIQRLPGDWAT
ncbi:Uncharacterised protein [Shigella flexneri]|nr:Uncharacterised protein [Shigella flexneri]